MQANLCKHDGDQDDSDGRSLSLTEDIILEVLLRLPAKALCWLRCVCKAWRTLISDPAFVAAQRSRVGPLIVAMFGCAPEHELRLLDKGGNILRVFDVKADTALLALTHLDRIFLDRVQLSAMIIDPASGHDFTIVGTNDLPPPGWTTTPTSTAVMSDYSFGCAAASNDYKDLHLVTSSRLFRPNQWCDVATIMDCAAETTWRQRTWGPTPRHHLFM